MLELLIDILWYAFLWCLDWIWDHRVGIMENTVSDILVFFAGISIFVTRFFGNSYLSDDHFLDIIGGLEDEVERLKNLLDAD